MTNPILEQLGKESTSQNQTQLSNSQNPILNNLNIPPDVKSRLQGMLDAAGGDPKQAFFNACQQNGLNPNTIINAIQNNMQSLMR